MMAQFMMDLKNEPIHHFLKNVKSFEYPFHHMHHHLQQQQQQQQQHHQLHRQQQLPAPEPEVLDLSRPRRDSTETRKTTSPSSYEEGSPSARHSPAASLLNHHHHIPKRPFTPEHAIQYNYDHHASPTTTNIRVLYNHSPTLRKISDSPLPETKPSFFLPSQVRPVMSDHLHDDISNDSPCVTSNISSSSSTASSQKSPSSSSTATAGPMMMVMGRDGKLSRPFKAYPKDPLSLAAAGSLIDASSAEKYSVFRKRMLEQIHAANGGNPVINNPKMRRLTTSSSKTSLETNNNEPIFDENDMFEKPSLLEPTSKEGKDEAYFERRRKNNAAAKKSRDRRRIKEDEIAIRAAFLERENIELKFELAAARKQLGLYGQQLSLSPN